MTPLDFLYVGYFPQSDLAVVLDDNVVPNGLKILHHVRRPSICDLVFTEARLKLSFRHQSIDGLAKPGHLRCKSRYGVFNGPYSVCLFDNRSFEGIDLGECPTPESEQHRNANIQKPSDYRPHVHVISPFMLMIPEPRPHECSCFAHCSVHYNRGGL
ncbi:MAG: hypothetical protein ACYS7Y_29100, partial [Planctomycetota bacterium]